MLFRMNVELIKVKHVIDWHCEAVFSRVGKMMTTSRLALKVSKSSTPSVLNIDTENMLCLEKSIWRDRSSKTREVPNVALGKRWSDRCTALFQQCISYLWQFVVNKFFVSNNSCKIISFLQNQWNSCIMSTSRDVSTTIFYKENTINFHIHNQCI
jgi:hypothetical protein